MKLQHCFLAAALICAGWPSAALAQYWGGHNEQRVKERDQVVEEIYNQLNLSEEQKKLLKENKLKHKEAVQASVKELKAAMDAQGEELKQKDPDFEKLNTMNAQMKNLRNQMSDERFNAIVEVRKILTQEQFAKFIELLQQHKQSKSQM